MASERVCVLTVAGSDSGGGAGIQADLKTFAALGVHGLTAVAAVTAQNTRGVSGYEEISAGMIRRQIEAVAGDFPVAALKTGMLASTAIIECVAAAVDRHRFPQVVVDPVMVAKSGDSLLREEAMAALCRLLIPRAMVLTPNLKEAEAILGRRLEGDEAVREGARALHALGARAVVMKGGHRRDTPLCVDLLFDGRQFTEFTAPWVETRNDHGTGCTFASATAALLARGRSLPDAVRGAKDYVQAALIAAVGRKLGGGRGPLEHFPVPLPESAR